VWEGGSIVTDPRFADGAAYIDGEYVPIQEARIPILDHGFLRSDATYDVAHVWKGYMFRLEDHLDRFERNVAALRMRLPLGRNSVRDVLIECVRRSDLRDAFVHMSCTRGIPPRGIRDPRKCENRFYAFAIPFVWIATEEQRANGLHLHISSIQRIPRASVEPTVKNFHWIDLVRGLFEAYDSGADVEVLVDGQGNVTEGPGFNLFVVSGGQLATPATGVLDGMTRRTVFDLCRDIDVVCRAENVSIERVRRGEELFVTSTAGGIMPVTKLDGAPVGAGAPGSVTKRLHDLYWSRKASGWLGTAIDYEAPARGPVEAAKSERLGV
jgi:branched-chain amino acid aminotransferase